jgi:uncharacterized membrane protein YkoI
MITEEKAINIATEAIKGTYEAEELKNIEAKLDDNRYIIRFNLILPPNTLGGSFIEVTVDAGSGAVLRRLRDAD